MDYKRYIRAIEKVTNKEELFDTDWLAIANLVQYLKDMNPVGEFVTNLETFSAADLAEEEFQLPSASQLANRLEACESHVTTQGQWDYDKVPADLIKDLMDFLEGCT